MGVAYVDTKRRPLATAFYIMHRGLTTVKSMVRAHCKRHTGSAGHTRKGKVFICKIGPKVYCDQRLLIALHFISAVCKTKTFCNTRFHVWKFHIFGRPNFNERYHFQNGTTTLSFSFIVSNFIIVHFPSTLRKWLIWSNHLIQDCPRVYQLLLQANCWLWKRFKPTAFIRENTGLSKIWCDHTFQATSFDMIYNSQTYLTDWFLNDTTPTQKHRIVKL